jgi:hypothetical protein
MQYSRDGFETWEADGWFGGKFIPKKMESGLPRSILENLE